MIFRSWVRHGVAAGLSPSQPGTLKLPPQGVSPGNATVPWLRAANKRLLTGEKSGRNVSLGAEIKSEVVVSLRGAVLVITKEGNMPYLLVRHQVVDCAKWKRVFDGHAAARKAAGCRDGQLFRRASDPHEVFVLLQGESLEKARQFTQSGESKQVREQAGVADQPDIYLLEELEKLTR